MIEPEGTIFDIIGAGFGPSNLALAVAIDEHGCLPDCVPLRPLFLESQPEFNWHPGMLMDSTRLQVSFLKDVVTMRNPRSRFTFLNYLAVHGRLHKFINLRETNPTRIEFNDYFRWIAGQFRDVVKYGRRVLSVHPVEDPLRDGVCAIKAIAQDVNSGQREEYLCRNLVVATGGRPHLPDVVDGFTHDRVFHSSRFLERIGREFPDRDAAHRFVVVGAGQSAAEILSYLLGNYPRASIVGIVRGFGFRPMDESHFVNELFSPQTVDTFYHMSPSLRSTLLTEHRFTNYAAVDEDLIRDLYSLLYHAQLAGGREFKILQLHEVRGLEESAGRLVVRLSDLAAERAVSLETDSVIFATGYDFPKLPPLLAPLTPYLVHDSPGVPRVSRDYRVATREGFAPQIYLQGFCEETHGISDTLLSILAIRSWRIVQAILDSRGTSSAFPDPGNGDRGCSTGHALDSQHARPVPMHAAGGRAVGAVEVTGRLPTRGSLLA